MKKVLIITYYWPPAGGPGVQRWLKFVKYLREFNWEPVVYTVKNPNYHIEDQALLNEVPEGIEVLRKEIFEPYELASIITGKKDISKVKGGFIESEKEQNLISRLTTWIRGNFFIPDARMFWIRPSVKFLNKYLKENHIDAIVSTGPPHSTHLIANKLKQKTGVKWIADFRDPWTNIDYYSKLRLSKYADAKHHRLEREVLQNSDEVIVVGNTMKDEFIELGAKNVSVLPNGFDFEKGSSQEVELDEKFSISHIGSMNADRNPEALWKAMAKIAEENADFKSDLEIKLIGNVSKEVIDSINAQNLVKNLNKVEYMSHNDVILEQKKSQLLLLVLNNTNNAKGIVTGKFFEYLNSKRPILAVGPKDGDLAEILKETKSGKIADYNDADALYLLLKEFYISYRNGKLLSESENFEKFSRRNICSELSVLLNKITEFSN